MADIQVGTANTIGSEAGLKLHSSISSVKDVCGAGILTHLMCCVS